MTKRERMSGGGERETKREMELIMMNPFQSEVDVWAGMIHD